MKTPIFTRSTSTLRTGLVMIAAVVLSACASSRYTQEQIAQSTEALAQVETAYQQGNYGDVIRRVATDSTLHDAPKDIRVQALKLQAFSLCMNEYEVMCQERFQEILALKPDFTLQESEEGHPLWGPVFERAKQSQ